MIRRLRPLPADLATLYPEPHDHARYGLGHHLRVELTITLARTLMAHKGWSTIADLSCGNGSIARALTESPTLGDYASGWPIAGPLETTLPTIDRHDVYVCSETLEHVDNPTLVLQLARARATGLILSTPLECWDDDNDEHLWAWDRAGVESLLDASGWTPVTHVTFDARVFGETYLYGMWVAE